MENDVEIISKESINLNIEDKSLSQGFFSFFLSKKQVLSLCPYKDMLIILMNDSTLMLYEILNSSKKIEIKELDKYKPIEIKILYYQIPYFNKDYLLCICEKNILLLNITSFIIEYNLSLKEKVISSELFVLNNKYFLSILFQYKIILYHLNINNNSKENIPLSFDLYHEFKESNDKIINMKIFYNTNLIHYQTDKKLFFLTFPTKINKNSKELIFDKTENFQNLIPNKDELDDLNKKLESLYDTYKCDKFKYLDNYKNIIIEYSKLNNYFIIAIYNKLFIINSFYDYNKNDIKESEIDIKKGEKYFKILERITKNNLIISIKMIEPYLILISENKIYFYTSFNLNKCIKETNFDPSFDLLFYKPIYLLTNLHLLNYTEDVINFNDDILLKEISKNKKNDLSLNSRPVIYSFYNKDNTLNYICLEKLSVHINLIKKINLLYSNKFLSSLDYNRNNKNGIKQYYNRDLDKLNRKYIEYEVIKLFFDEIEKNNYGNALTIYIDNNMNVIFIIILIAMFIKSQLLNNLIILTFFKYIYQISLDFNNIKINIIENKEKDISVFIKIFFEILMQKRNEIKNNFTPEELKFIAFDNIINEIQLNSINKRINLSINDYNSYIEIVKLMEKKNEEIINFILLENIIFVLNYYSYKISKDYKFLANLFGLIKMSINILDPNIIDLLKENNLNNLILLFYFSKENYEQCFSNIISFFGKSSFDSNDDCESNKINDNNIFDEDLYINKNSEVNTIINTLSEIEKPKSYWFQTYIYLISKIKNKLSKEDFNKNLQWALKENCCKSIDLLLKYKIINNKKVDYDFIDLLNPYGLDAIIHYFSVFSNLKEGKAESNEIINLYSIKIKLLNAENSENKFKQEINETRNKLCKFLIKNKNYDVEKAYERIILDISFCEKEIGILLIKKNDYENGLNKILNIDENDLKENEDYIIELILLILEEIPSFELIKLFIDKLNNIKFTKYSNDCIILQIMKRISCHTDILIELLNTNIFDEFDNSEISDFFLENIFSLEKRIFYNKIEASLIGSQILDYKNILYDKQSESALINYKTICHKCKKNIYEEGDIKGKNEFGVKTNNGKIYHLECFNNLQNKE